MQSLQQLVKGLQALRGYTAIDALRHDVDIQPQCLQPGSLKALYRRH